MSAQPQQTKVAVSVSEMARMVGLSRARFYQLMAHGCFPRPNHDPDTGRPYFDEAQQGVCLEVRRRNCGIDDKSVLFYAKRVEIRPTVPRPRRPTVAKPRSDDHGVHADLLDAMKSLGLTTATKAQVQVGVAELFPQGVAGIDQGVVIKKLFIHIKRQDTGDNVRRQVPLPARLATESVYMLSDSCPQRRRYSGDKVFEGIPAGPDEPGLVLAFLNGNDFSAQTRRAFVNDLKKFARWFT